jgi:hypothetical protein
MIVDETSDAKRPGAPPSERAAADVLREARELAARIAAVLGTEQAREPYALRLARALAADLNDQLAKLARGDAPER